jgi:hypothetical protein
MRYFPSLRLRIRMHRCLVSRLRIRSRSGIPRCRMRSRCGRLALKVAHRPCVLPCWALLVEVSRGLVSRGRVRLLVTALPKRRQWQQDRQHQAGGRHHSGLEVALHHYSPEFPIFPCAKSTKQQVLRTTDSDSGLLPGLAPANRRECRSSRTALRPSQALADPPPPFPEAQ